MQVLKSALSSKGRIARLVSAVFYASTNERRVFSTSDGQKMPTAGLDRAGGKEASRVVAMDVAGAGVAADAGSVSSNLYDDQVGYATGERYLLVGVICAAMRAVYRRPKRW